MRLLSSFFNWYSLEDDGLTYLWIFLMPIKNMLCRFIDILRKIHVNESFYYNGFRNYHFLLTISHINQLEITSKKLSAKHDLIFLSKNWLLLKNVTLKLFLLFSNTSITSMKLMDHSDQMKHTYKTFFHVVITFQTV